MGSKNYNQRTHIKESNNQLRKHILPKFSLKWWGQLVNIQKKGLSMVILEWCGPKSSQWRSDEKLLSSVPGDAG